MTAINAYAMETTKSDFFFFFVLFLFLLFIIIVYNIYYSKKRVDSKREEDIKRVENREIRVAISEYNSLHRDNKALKLKVKFLIAFIILYFLLQLLP